jgi:hypothetical protein
MTILKPPTIDRCFDHPGFVNPATCIYRCGITANIWVQKGICLEGFRVGSKASHRTAFLVTENSPEKETVVAHKLVQANRLEKQGKQIGSKPIWKPGRRS